MKDYDFIHVFDDDDQIIRVGVNYSVHSHGDSGCITGPSDNWVEPSGPELDIDDCDVLDLNGEVLGIELTGRQEQTIEDEILEHYMRRS